jgi:hypothetical protein
MNTKKERVPQTPSGVSGESMNNKISLICAHCKGSIIQKYDRIYCIQCSREPNQSNPATISNKEYKQDRRGDISIKQRITRVAQERGI